MALKSKSNELKISRLYDAPLQAVWDAWTDPKQAAHWWGPRGFTTTTHSKDLKPGGHWHYTMHGPDGTDYPNKSIFEEVVKPERLVFSHTGGKKHDAGAPFVATWTFEDVGGKTRVTGRMVFPTAAHRDHVVKVYGAIEGAKQNFDRLGEYLAKSK